MHNPLVSVIIPVYNSERTLHQCIKSLSKQYYTNTEIIIIDSDSTDKTKDVALRWCKKIGNRCKYFNIHSRSRTKARNYGVSKSNGEIIVTLDSDAYISLNYIERGVRKLLEGNYDGLRPFVDEVWRHKGYLAKCYYHYIYGIRSVPFRKPYVNFVKRDIWIELDGQREDFEIGEDRDFTNRFERAGYRAPILDSPPAYHNMNTTIKSILKRMYFNTLAKNSSTQENSDVKSSYCVLEGVLNTISQKPAYSLGMALILFMRLVTEIISKLRGGLEIQNA